MDAIEQTGVSVSVEPDLTSLLPKKIPEIPPVPEGMRLFTMYRSDDTSGVSGSGKIVLQGCVFANKKVAAQWLVGPDPGDTQVKDDWERFLSTHVYSHPENGTILTFGDGEQIKHGWIFNNPPKPESKETEEESDEG